jgi:maltose alpha-D-glucosyltransferase/alpha-amylase
MPRFHRYGAGHSGRVNDRWYRQAVIYCVDVETFQDSDGDGVGDLPGLISRLDYLSRLGVTCLWLNPVHPTPNRDDGYDITDYYGVDPRLGSLGDLAQLVHEAGNLGIRVILDLVVNHTSDAHPWFVSARSEPGSRYRDWYVWSPDAPPDRHQGMVFPGTQKETWTYDRHSRSYYYHRFYEFEPDLNTANPAVRAEIRKIVAFWLQLGVAGFRMDAAPFVIERTRPGDPTPPLDFGLLAELHEHLSWRRGDAVVLAEANVPNSEFGQFFGDGASANRLQMIFAFGLNQATMLALARQDARPLRAAVANLPVPPAGGQWCTFLRNHDEIDLSRLTEAERDEVFAAFGPEENMRLYGRGIRRRLAPMLGGDRARLELAYSLQFTLPGTPVLRYGEEIGMGDDLALPERNAIRTPMQWSGADNGGFSPAPAGDLVRPVVDGGAFGYQTVNVARQRREPDSLLSWFERMIRTARECPEIGLGRWTVLPVRARSVLAVRYEADTGTVLFVHNLGEEPVRLDLGRQDGQNQDAVELFADQDYPRPSAALGELDVGRYGYRWFRLARWA